VLLLSHHMLDHEVDMSAHLLLLVLHHQGTEPSPSIAPSVLRLMWSKEGSRRMRMRMRRTMCG